MANLKKVFLSHLNKEVSFGRKKLPAHGPRLHLKNYLTKELAAPPASCDYTAKATKALSEMYSNDSLGDCVIACGYHLIGLTTGNATDTAFIASTQQILKDYEAIGGYVPGEPSTDQGCNEETALNYWSQHGFADGSKLLGWLAVDATNETEVKQCMYLFENLVFGISLPDAWTNEMPQASGFTWDVAGAPDENQGHCICGVGFNSAGVQINTWGLIGTLTWDAVKTYAVKENGGELYVALFADQIVKGSAKAPNDVAWDDLIADFDNLGGKVIPPNSPPAPVVPPVTLAQAEAWVSDGFSKAGVVMTKVQAVTHAKKGLTDNWPTS